MPEAKTEARIGVLRDAREKRIAERSKETLSHIDRRGLLVEAEAEGDVSLWQLKAVRVQGQWGYQKVGRVAEISRKSWEQGRDPGLTVPEKEVRRPRPGRVGSTRLDTVQKIRPLSGWKIKRDAADKRLKDKIVKELRKRGELEPRSDRMEICGTRLGHRICDECGEIHEPERYLCNYYHACPTCQRIRSKRMLGEMLPVFEGLELAKGYMLRFVTLTMKTEVGRYREATKQAIKAFGRWHRAVCKKKWKFVPFDSQEFQTPKDRSGKPGVYIGRCQRVYWDTYKNVGELEAKAGYWIAYAEAKEGGGYRSLEFGTLNGNVHIHAILATTFLPQAVIREQWEQLTGSYVIDVRLVRGQLESDREIPLKKAVQELCKYTVKFADVSVEKLVDFWEAMKGRQVTQRYGIIRQKVRCEEEILNDFTCQGCGQHKYHWCYFPFDVAYQPMTERGPPSEHWLAVREAEIFEEWQEKTAWK